MTTTLIKQEAATQGMALSNRYRARRFKTSEAMNKFLGTADNSLFWKPCAQDLASGRYTSQMTVCRETRKAIVTYRKI